MDGTCEKATVPVFERFGLFRHERRVYDDEYQWTRDGRVFIGHRWNIWKGIHRLDGSLLPEAYRETGTVNYTTNVDFPADESVWMKTAATRQDVAAGRASEVGLVTDWDEALRETVASHKRIAGMTSATRDDIPPIFTIKKNSCSVKGARDFAAANDLQETLSQYGISEILPGNLKRACSVLEWASDGAFTWQKVGDLRHSFLHWVDTPQQAGPLGYGPSSADPITGELISATANIYGAAVDEYAAYAADVVSLMNGSMTLDEVTEGSVIRDHIEATRLRTNRDLSMAKTGAYADGMRGAGAFLPSRMSMAYNPASRRYEIDESSMEALREDAVATAGRGLNKLEKLQGTAFERELLMSDELKRAVLGPNVFQPGQTLPAEYGDFSITEWMTEDLAVKHNEALMKVASHSVMMADWADPGITSLADDLKGMTWEDVYDHLRGEIYQSVMAHEVGHTLGLRHNFQGSFDALNYQPSFWTEHYHYDAGTATGSIDKEGGGDKYMYSSIMDYDARFFADSLQGIGLYDKAAIKFAYGQLVEAFTPETAAWGFENFLFLNDYTDIPKMFGDQACKTDCGAQGCYLVGCSGDVADDFMSFQNAYSDYVDNWNAARDAEADGDSVLAAQLDAQADIDYANYSRYQNDWVLEGLRDATPAPERIYSRMDVPFAELVDLQTRYWLDENVDLPDEVPYKFCPDEYAGYTWVECQPYDKGASFLEVTRDRMERYDSYYFFTNFKRDRALFNDWSYADSYLNRIYSRFFAPMSNTYIYYLYSFINMGENTDGTRLTLNDFPVGVDWQSAGMEGLNFLTSVVQQPEPGDYCRDENGTPLDTTDDVYRPTADPVGCTTDAIDVPLGVGKYYYTTWTDEYDYKATRLGTFLDKYAATFAMTTNEGFFYRDFSSYFDVGAFALSYWSDPRLRDGVLNLFEAAFTGEDSKFAWRFDPSQTDGSLAFRPTHVVDIYQDPVDLSLPRIEASTSYTLRWYGVALPMVRFNAMFDYTADFSNYSRVCLDGYTDCMAFDPAVGQTEYVDPLTNYRYVASNTDIPEHAVGARMLEEAQEYADTTYADAKAVFDSAQCEPSCTPAQREALEAARVDLLEAERGVNQRSSFIDTIRQLGYMLD
jgi:hypothetical protein